MPVPLSASWTESFSVSRTPDYVLGTRRKCPCPGLPIAIDGLFEVARLYGVHA